MASSLDGDSSLDLLRRACDEIVHSLEASGCSISRRIGDLLIDVAEDSLPDSDTRLGRGCLISDYPATGEVIRRRVPLAVSLEDEDADPGEAAVLEELGFASLLMLPFVSGGVVWGLVEVYGSAGRRFGDDDAARAARILREAGVALERLRAA